MKRVSENDFNRNVELAVHSIAVLIAAYPILISGYPYFARLSFLMS
jgi:hypothetical protein